MKDIFSRVWTGFVSALAGTCVGVLLTIVLLSMGFSLELAFWMIAALAVLGGIGGFVIGNRKVGGE